MAAPKDSAAEIARDVFFPPMYARSAAHNMMITKAITNKRIERVCAYWDNRQVVLRRWRLTAEDDAARRRRGVDQVGRHPGRIADAVDGIRDRRRLGAGGERERLHALVAGDLERDRLGDAAAAELEVGGLRAGDDVHLHRDRGVRAEVREALLGERRMGTVLAFLEQGQWWVSWGQG